MRQKVVVGNWKLNGSVAGNEALLKALTWRDSPERIGRLRGMRAFPVSRAGPGAPRRIGDRVGSPGLQPP